MNRRYDEDSGCALWIVGFLLVLWAIAELIKGIGFLAGWWHR